MRMIKTTGSKFVKTKSAFRGLCIEYYKKNIDNIIDATEFLQISKPGLIEIIVDAVKKSSIKYNIKLEATYILPNTVSKQNRAFKTQSRSVFESDDINQLLEVDFDKILQEKEEMVLKGSGYSLYSIDGIIINVNVYKPLGGSSYIPLPASIQAKKATVNVKNYDEKCFMYSILAKLVNPNHAERLGSNYSEVEGSYDFSNLSFPVSLKNVENFEKLNQGVSVNVYGFKRGEYEYKNNVKKIPKKNLKNSNLNPTYIVYPSKVCDVELDDHHDLLLFGDGNGNHHYCRITNLPKLIGSQLSFNVHAIIMCKRCFKTYSGVDAQQRLKDHKLNCIKNKLMNPSLPNPNTHMTFKNWIRTQKHPFSIYADFESLLQKENDSDNESNTRIIHHHDVMSYCYYVKPSDDIPKELLEKYDIKCRNPVVCRGDSSFSKGEVAKKFLQEIVQLGLKIENLLNTNVPLIMNENENRLHRDIADRGTCPLCKAKFNSNNLPVRDHNHLTGKYRGTTCSKCNLLMVKPNFVPCFFHNLSGYDSHFLVTQLGFDSHSISVIPNSEEKFISFTKYITNRFQIRFVDTYRFMASSLEKLVGNLYHCDTDKFREIKKIFNNVDIDLVTRKGIYPYEYTDSWDKLQDKCLPPKSEFYSSLTESNIDEADYQHALRVWNYFNFKTLGEYSDWYIKVDVMLLCDVFENFRDLCLKTYGLDPNFYYTAPGMSFDCCLKITEVKLELLSDYDQILMVEAGIRGGLTQASMRYACANNKDVSDYDLSKPDSWIVYLDATNLYVFYLSHKNN